MKERPILFSAPMVRAILDGRKTQTRRVVKDKYLVGGPPEHALLETCPYGQTGDKLWVRETFWQPADKSETLYRADGAVLGCGKWIPSIHMPRAVSRIDLLITSVRVERLQDICQDDAKAEGTRETRVRKGNSINWQSARSHFADLWRSINGPKSWDENPWVWVMEFKRASA